MPRKVKDAAGQPLLIPEAVGGAAETRKPRPRQAPDADNLPPNLGQPVPVKVPNFADPQRPKTCLEVDFPIVPINALSALEGNAGKPIYQMSKWWARRRSCVFRAMLIAAAMEAPVRQNPDGSPMRDEKGLPIPDETEAAKAVWDVYYANHQKAGNFRHLAVLDCFMGGGTTLVEGSRLGFQVAGVDLNPVAWFIVKNELACTDPQEVQRFFDQIEAEVKPQIQPFYVTDCPRGHKGRWIELATGNLAAVDPVTLPPEQRKKYRYEGPEVIYTFWAKHGPCARHDCNHRTPVFRSPIIAEKKLGVKYMELTCKECKTVFHAELGSARMAPGADRVVLENETPFTELSQPFARRLHEYGSGSRKEKDQRIIELAGMVDEEPGLRCPRCGSFAGQWVRDVLKKHTKASRLKDIDKKDFRILPPRNGTKPVYCYLLIQPDWLKGSPGVVDGRELGGYADAPPEATAAWYAERLRGLKLIEVRGRVKLHEGDSPLGNGEQQTSEPESDGPAEGDEPETEDRKAYGLPRHITVADGRQIDTGQGTVPKDSHFACGACGLQQDFRSSVQKTRHTATVSTYAIQGFCPQCTAEGQVYGGRFFAAPAVSECRSLGAAESEWAERRYGDLNGYWPREEIPYSYMTHHANFPLPEQGYTHWWKMFDSRQLLVHSLLLKTIMTSEAATDTRHQALGALQQYLRNQCGFVFWNSQADKIEPFFSNSNYAPKMHPVENCVFASLGRGNWTSSAEGVLEGLRWVREPWEVAPPAYRKESGESRLPMNDPVQAGGDVRCGSASALTNVPDQTVDCIITDPPFGDNVFYSDLANFFHAWLRLPLSSVYVDLFGPTQTPAAQEVLASRMLPDDEANARYLAMLTACWLESHRVLKDGGILAFTFHHSEDAQWAIVLQSLFDAGLYLEATYPIRGDETKGENSSFGARAIEYDMIHVCRKRLDSPKPVSWPKMRQWVKAELHRLRRLLDSYKDRELPEADVRVILRGKALEFYSRHYGCVLTADNHPLSIQHALLGINQILDEDAATADERPPAIVQPLGYQFLRLFRARSFLARDELSKSLRGTGITQRDFEEFGWVREENKVVRCVPIQNRFQLARTRPRKDVKNEIDQAHFLIGAALPGSGLNLEGELAQHSWTVRRSVQAVLDWYLRTASDPEIRNAATLAGDLLRRSFEEYRTKRRTEQGLLFDDLYEEE
jgi:adenine-specific DNA methylase